MTAGNHNFIMEQGATFKRDIFVKDSAGNPWDLTGYSARMQIRQTVDDPSTLLDISTATGEITITAASGLVTIEVPATTTETLSWTGDAVYDLELEDGSGFVTRLIQGKVTLSLEVTR